MAGRRVRLYSWNVNGVRAIARKGFHDWLRSTGAEVVALQETKAAPEQLEAALRSPEGYHAEWCAAEKRGYSGVATLARERPLAVSRGLGDSRFDVEGRVLVSEHPGFTLYNVYFPSGSSGSERVAYKLQFYEHFLKIVAARVARGEPIVVCGDVNTAFAPIDLARPRENVRTSGFLPEERSALGRFFEAGLVDTFRHVHPDAARYSWWSQVTAARERNVGWRLDYFLVSPALRDRIVDADIHADVGGSDHCPVSLTLEI